MPTNDELQMRPVERRDLEPLRLMHNDPSTLSMLADTTPVTPAMQERWFESLADGRTRRYVVEDGDGTLVALLRIDALDLVNRNASVGLDVMPHLRRCGYGRRCMDLLLRYVFLELDLRTAWLATAAFNEPAQRLYRKVGFRECGRLPEMLYRGGGFHDLVMMSLRRADWEAAQQDGETE